jgi:acetyl-CoA carboxylase biotin carboxyl carrier protein
MKEGNLEISMKAGRTKVKPSGVVVENAPMEVVAAPEKQPEEAQGTVVKSPLVGTFYAAASPEEAPFVKVGDRVTKGQVLGIIEAMKLMNEIESEVDGTILEIHAENEVMVEYGEPLFVIG